MNTITKGKIQKRKPKQVVEFGADNINNTAPVKKILEDLQHKNIPAFGFYCQTIRPRRAVKYQNYSFHFTLTGHPLYAFPDGWDGDLNTGYFEPFIYKSLMPKFITPLKNIEKSDPITDYIKKKNVWSHDCKTLRQSAISSSIMEKYESLNEEVVRCPKHFVDIAAHWDSDPDPYFNDSYNWYYGGNGNMQLICVDWVDYLLYAEFSTLYLSQLFKSTEISLNTDYTSTFHCEGDPILETICSVHNIVALRTKKKIIILKIISSNDKIIFEKIKAVESVLPFTSISFDNYHKHILYITTLDNKVTIVNLDRVTGKTINFKSKIDSLVNNWNTVISSDRITFTHVTRNSISIYDKRMNNTSYTWKGVRELTDHSSCNDITVAKQCEGSASLYYGTDHHLFLIDLRHQRKCKLKPLLRWTHGMQCVPSYMSICNFESNKQLICLCSQWCEDICVVSNYDNSLLKHNEISGVTMPYRPPSILDTLNEARQKQLCFDLYNPIDKRLGTAIDGHIIFEHGENYVILMHNSLGDISCHMLYPKHMESFVEDESIQHLHEWSKSFKKEKKEFEVSAVEDISNIWKELKHIPQSYKFCFITMKDKTELYEKEVYHTFEKEELDGGLLDVWTKNTNESTMADSSSFGLHLHYSEDLCENE